MRGIRAAGASIRTPCRHHRRLADESSAGTVSTVAPHTGGFNLHQLNLLCQYSYGVARGDGLTHVGRHRFLDQSLGFYWVIRSHYCSGNGFEGMVTTPDRQGRPDYRHLTVVFAGTNLRDDTSRDILAALTTFLAPFPLPWSQIGEARAMADNALGLARKQVGTSATILLTGHSMGGGLALMQANRLGMPARAFCAVDPWRAMDRHHRTLIETHRAKGLLQDYRLTNDLVTGTVNHILTGCTDRSARIIWCGRGAGGFNHWLSHFTYDANGNPVANPARRA